MSKKKKLKLDVVNQKKFLDEHCVRKKIKFKFCNLDDLGNFVLAIFANLANLVLAIFANFANLANWVLAIFANLANLAKSILANFANLANLANWILASKRISVVFSYSRIFT